MWATAYRVKPSCAGMFPKCGRGIGQTRGVDAIMTSGATPIAPRFQLFRDHLPDLFRNAYDVLSGPRLLRRTMAPPTGHAVSRSRWPGQATHRKQANEGVGCPILNGARPELL
jgi:hypothetical protein